MKKLAATLCLTALASAAFAQGTINFGNIATALISTNATASAGTMGNTPPSTSGNPYYYAVFTANSTVTTVDTSLQQLLTTTWTFDGVYATNTAATAGGRLSGGLGVATVSGWPAGVTNSFIVVGWSGNLGHDWATVSAEMTGSTHSGGKWSGGSYPASANNEFLGYSAISFGAAGGGASGNPAFSLWNTAVNAQGNPLNTGFTLDIVSAAVIPEPSTFALAGFGAAALLIFRRRK